MNQKKWRLSCIIALIFICSCQSDPYDNAEFPSATNSSSKFSPQEARSYFERTAEDLRAVSFRHTHSMQTKSSICEQPESQEVFTPLWNDLRQTDENDLCVTMEIPLETRGGPLLGWCESHLTGDRPGGVSPVAIASNLVIKKNIETDDIFYFVATFIPDPTCARERKGQKHPYRFMMDRQYSGYVVISDVTGEYVTAFLHRNGSHCQVHLRIPESEQPTDSSEVTDRLRLATPGAELMTRSADSEQDETRYYCAYCNWQIVNGSCPNPNCKPVEVVACPVCHSQECVCCPVCKSYPCKCNPKTCTNANCPYGGYCNGLCSTGSGGGTGGGGSTGGGTTGGGGTPGGNITPQSFSWKPGTPYPTVSTTYVRWKNLFNNAQTTLDFRLIYINSAIVDGKFIIRNFKYPSNIGYVTKDPYSGKWYIDLDASQIPQGTFAEQLIMVHELYHLHLYLKAGVTKPTSSDNDDHHRQMVEDGIYVEWLKKMFPGHKDAEYELMKYAGTTLSPVFINESSSKKKQINTFFLKNSILH